MGPDRCLYFLPHCGRRLYSNLLEANWSSEGLSRLLLLGNSFGAYGFTLSDAGRNEGARHCRLLRAASIVKEQPCGSEEQNTFDHAFTNLSLHSFAPPWLLPAGSDFWV